MLKRLVSSYNAYQNGGSHKNNTARREYSVKMLGDRSVTTTGSSSALPPAIQGLEQDLDPGSFFPMSPVCSFPLSALLNIQLFCSKWDCFSRRAEEALTGSSLLALPRALCRQLAWELSPQAKTAILILLFPYNLCEFFNHWALWWQKKSGDAVRTVCILPVFYTCW